MADLRDQRGIRARVGAAERGAHQRGHVLEPAREVGEEAQRRPVAPVQVVHRQQHRPVRGHVRGQPVEAVERREGGVGDHPVGARVRGLEDRPRGRGGAGQPALASLPVGERRLEELPHDPERELALELAATRGEHPHVVLLRRPPKLREQPALTDARRTLHQREPAAPARGVLEHGTERLELAVSFQKQLGGASVAHLADIVGGDRVDTPPLRTVIGRRLYHASQDEPPACRTPSSLLGPELLRPSRAAARSAKLAGPRSRR